MSKIDPAASFEAWWKNIANGFPAASTDMDKQMDHLLYVASRAAWLNGWNQAFAVQILQQEVVETPPQRKLN